MKRSGWFMCVCVCVFGGGGGHPFQACEVNDISAAAREGQMEAQRFQKQPYPHLFHFGPITAHGSLIRKLPTHPPPPFLVSV
jgi:hypothetical protein